MKHLCAWSSFPTGDCQQPAQCRIQKCTTDFVSLTSHLNSAADGFDSEFCKALRAYAGCTQRTSKACRGNLVYHSAVLGISDLMSQRNCSKDGPTSSTNPEVTHDPCNYHSHGGVREHRGGDQSPPNYLFCGLFGDPHLRTFKDHFQTCKVEGAWPLIDNNYLSVQVTNVPVVPGSSATATNKASMLLGPSFYPPFMFGPSDSCGVCYNGLFRGTICISSWEVINRVGKTLRLFSKKFFWHTKCGSKRK